MIQRFNRTFMELKYKINIIWNINWQVSIVPLWNWNCVFRDGKSIFLACFNRTFMELKSMFCITINGLAPVSIVPLWNWNRWATWQTSRTREFQSYLYGIEIGNCKLHDCRWGGVSIVPLWNWNRRYCSVPQRIDGRFNRTFMELKLSWQTTIN